MIIVTKSQKAFSLIELLTVVALISLLLVITVSGLGARRGFSLNAGGNLVADLVQQARLNSMAKGNLTLIALIDDPSYAEKHQLRAFVLMEKSRDSGAWQAIGRWEHLPEGVIASPKTFNASSTTSFLSQTPAVAVSNLPNLGGQAVAPSSCKYQVFLPSGRLSTKGIATPASPVLSLVETTEKDKAAPQNFYEVKINLHTGVPSVIRP